MKFNYFLFSCLDLKNSLKEEFNNKIKFFRDEVELRIESLKTDLDLLKDEFGKKFDVAKKEAERYDYQNFFIIYSACFSLKKG